jgi:meso-butanediol dehydrogenase/(S,S)-butanediol dehydrogenase/diacetyl reductase
LEGPVKGQVAIVTGGGQGIGRAIALRLAQDGMDVVVADLRGDHAEAVVAEIRKLGVRALPLTLDVASAHDRQRMIAETLVTFNRLDVLVNNAAIQRIAMPLDVTEQHWDSVMNINAKAVYFCCVAALEHMTVQKSGRIINISSAAGKTASTVYHPVYNISKAAVIALTKTLALAHAADGVRINAVCPGIVATPMQDLIDKEASRLIGKTPEETRAERLSRVPMGRVETPEEVAAVVSFLVGPDSRYMTAQAINVTGGMVTY